MGWKERRRERGGDKMVEDREWGGRRGGGRGRGEGAVSETLVVASSPSDMGDVDWASVNSWVVPAVRGEEERALFRSPSRPDGRHVGAYQPHLRV
eukprot:765794-Hanusia_phi.AAC.2